MGLIRLLLAISVMITHQTGQYTYMVAGDMAVQSFFIISGFFMSYIITEKYRQKKNGYRLFITNRLLKIYPTYWLVAGFILIAIMISPKLNTVDARYDFLRYYMHHPRELQVSTWVYAAEINIFTLGAESAYFFGFNAVKGILYYAQNLTSPPIRAMNFVLVYQAWILPLEIYFYCISPYILKQKLKWIVLIIVGTGIARYYLSTVGMFWDYEPWIRRFFFTQIGIFLLGRISYDIYVKMHTRKLPKRLPAVITLGMVLMIIFYYQIPNLTLYHFDVNRSLYTLLFTAAIPFVFLYTKTVRLDRLLGELSYPVFLTHAIVIDMVRSYAPVWEKTYGSSVLYILVFLVSYAIYRFLMKPIDAFRQRRVHSLP